MAAVALAAGLPVGQVGGPLDGGGDIAAGFLMREVRGEGAVATGNGGDGGVAGGVVAEGAHEVFDDVFFAVAIAVSHG